MEEVLRSSTWFGMDGTFRITPKPGNIMDVRASQVLNITAENPGGGVVLLFSVIMTSRKIGLYKKVFKFLKQNFPHFKPPQMMSDFELAMRKGFKSVYPTAKVYGCRFHFSKSIFAKIKGRFRLGKYLRPTGSEGQVQLSHRLRQYLGLPLLRPEHMHPEMTRLKNEIKALVIQYCTEHEQKAFNKLHNYIITSWMKRLGPEEISVYGALHKTNNITER